MTIAFLVTLYIVAGGFTSGYLIHMWSNGYDEFIFIILAALWPIYWIIHVPYMLGLATARFLRWVNSIF